MRVSKLFIISILTFAVACNTCPSSISKQGFAEAIISRSPTPCEAALASLGGYSVQEGGADYRSGERIFPLLRFILTKHAVPAANPEQEVYMRDNPIFATKYSKYEHIIVFAPIHSKRTGALHGVIGYPDNEVIHFYLPMVLGEEDEYKEVVPSVKLGSSNEIIEVNRQTWHKELKSSIQPCDDELLLPPAIDETKPFFHYNGKIYPFSKEIDFVAGVEGVGFGLSEYGIRYPEGGDKIQIPILIYCPQCKIENVVMIQDGVQLQFNQDEYYHDWQQWLGKEWHAYTSEEIDFDEEKFKRADLDSIRSALPPFLSDSPATIEIMINGESVTFINH